MTGRSTGDEGASLVIALAFLTVVAVGSLALLTLADTSLRTTTAIRTQGYELHSASGGIEQAITQVRGELAQGREKGLENSFGPTGCQVDPITVNGVLTEVRCEGVTGSGVGSVGGAANDANTPPYAVLTRSTSGSEPGLELDGNDKDPNTGVAGMRPLRIKGPVVSNNAVRVSTGQSLYMGEGRVRALGNCSGTITGAATPAAVCPDTSLTTDEIKDPNWPMDATRPGAPDKPDQITGCPAEGGERLVSFSPGTYLSVSELNDVFSRCAGSVFWFKPGFYHFDFRDVAGDTLRWTITGDKTQVVGGEPLGWDPGASPAPGFPRPALVPFPAEVNGVKQDGGCIESSRPGAKLGVQFAFSGRSRMFVQDARVELCAPANTNAQQIAFYGIADRETTASVKPVKVTATSADRNPNTDQNGFKDHGEVVLEGGAAASFTTTAQKNQSSTASVTARFTAPFSVPFGAVITDVRVRVKHMPVNENVSSVEAVVTPGTGMPFTIPTTNNCGRPSGNLCAAATPDFYDQRISLPDSFRSEAAINNMSVKYLAEAKTTETGGQPKVTVRGEVRVDVLEVEVDYLPGTFRRLEGCAVTGTCHLLEAVGSKTQVALNGTLFAPTASIRLELTGLNTQVVRRGVVARRLHITSSASSTFTGNAIELPCVGCGGRANRKVRFVARQAGVDVLRVVVEFDDSVSAGEKARTTSWSVLR